ncbi:MAG: cell wall protein [Candidatus Leucobacter sulfamidivorax]|nr:cell wall protein [Candidatus Leucobacter sulfamidivorax]
MRIRGSARSVLSATLLLGVTLGLIAAPSAVAPAANAAPGDIVINEVESSGGSGVLDWVELTNTGAAPVDISGWIVKDDNDSRTLAVPASTVLAPGEFFAMNTEPDFGLGGADSIRIFLPDGTTLVDSFSWTSHAAQTYGRCPDGTGPFIDTLSPTRGAANDCPAPATVPPVVINEVESSGGTPGDWIELFNNGAEPADVSGWILRDDNPSNAFVLPAGSVIAPGGFLVADVETAFGLGGADEARLYLADGATLVDSYDWSAHAATSYGRCPDGTGAFATTLSSTRGAANDCPASPALPEILINEIESSGGTPGDWVELFNAGSAAVDVSGWIIRDNDDSHAFVLPAGSVIAPGGFLVADVETAFGLGGIDSARLYLADGTTLVDSHDWTSHATVTYGRCPDGSADWRDTTVSTRGAANDCSEPVDTLETSPWPGPAGMTPVDEANAFGQDMSGLVFEADGSGIWAVNNGDGTLHLLSLAGGALSEQGRWTLHYPDGTGIVDAEAVALIGGSARNGVLVGSERNNASGQGGVSRPSVLRYSVDEGSSALNATREWNLSGFYPGIGANAGIEGLAWVSDDFLVLEGLVDENTGERYDPDAYPAHGGGVVFVGVEATNIVAGYVLGDEGQMIRITQFATDFPGVMELEFDAASGQLWVLCDEVCQGRAQLFSVDASGAFVPTVIHERPAETQNYANEGFALAPMSQCVDGSRPALWADDNQTDGHAFRVGSIACSAGGSGGSGGPGSGSGGTGQLASTGMSEEGWSALIAGIAGLLIVLGSSALVARRRG